MDSTHKKIRHTLSKKKPGNLIFSSDFRALGTSAAVKKALSRLAREGVVSRLSQGVYYIPKTDPVLGPLRPSAEEVVQTIARKERIKLRPSGANALHRLGLTTHVPTYFVFISYGCPGFFSWGKLKFRFKTTTRKKLSTIGKISSLVIQALEELGIDQIDPDTERKIGKLLLQETPKHLQHDLTLSSTKISDYIVKLLRKQDNDQMVTPIGGAKKGFPGSVRTGGRDKSKSD